MRTLVDPRLVADFLGAGVEPKVVVRALADGAPAKPTGCQCEICVGDCPTCRETGQLCRGCDQHFQALADAAEADARGAP